IGARESAERAAHYLAGNPCVQLVYGFGSATQRDRATVRDVDLAVLTDPPLTLEDLTKRQADVISVTGAPIDLVSLHDASLVLAHEIVESGTCLYARTPDAETEFVSGLAPDTGTFVHTATSNGGWRASVAPSANIV